MRLGVATCHATAAAEVTSMTQSRPNPTDHSRPGALQRFPDSEADRESCTGLVTVSDVGEHVAMSRRSSAVWVVVLALAVGLGLIAMHTGVSGSEHTHGSDHPGALVAIQAGDDATHPPACDGCTSHSSVAMVCAVLLVAAGGGIAIRWRDASSCSPRSCTSRRCSHGVRCGRR